MRRGSGLWPPIPFSFFEKSQRHRTGRRTIDPILSSDEPVLLGRFRLVQLREGLVLHATETQDLHDLTTTTLQEPGFGFYLFFEDGEGLDTSLGGRPLPVGRHRTEGSGPVGFTMSWREPTLFERRAKRGTRVRKALVIVSHEWLEQTFGRNNATILTPSLQHLAISRWSPSYRLGKLVESLLEPDQRGDAVSRLRDESIALDLIGEAIATLEPPSGQAGLPRVETLQLNRARNLIEARLSDELSVSDIAGDLGMGVATLQRLFRAAYGCSVFDYVRTRRLESARLLLEQGRSVAAAAEAAGYSSAANFATAFRRKFGATPRQVRDGVPL